MKPPILMNDKLDYVTVSTNCNSGSISETIIKRKTLSGRLQINQIYNLLLLFHEFFEATDDRI